MNALITTKPAEAFRAKASELMITTATMTLHQLVDEFQRLTDVIEKNSEPDEEGFGFKLNDEAELAMRERRIVCGASRSRFGIDFSSWDRSPDTHHAASGL